MVESNSNRSRSPSVFKTVQGPAPITLHDWRTARDSNPEPLVLETRTLPIELAIHVWWRPSVSNRARQHSCKEHP